MPFTHMMEGQLQFLVKAEFRHLGKSTVRLFFAGVGLHFHTFYSGHLVWPFTSCDTKKHSCFIVSSVVLCQLCLMELLETIIALYHKSKTVEHKRHISQFIAPVSCLCGTCLGGGGGAC